MRSIFALLGISLIFMVLHLHSTVASEQNADAKQVEVSGYPNCPPLDGGEACAHCKDQEVEGIVVCGTDHCDYFSECVATCVGVGVLDPDGTCTVPWS